jgi:ABC-2 type transport system permease protein
MMLNSMFVVLKKEYLQRLKSVAFWLSTVLLPFFMVAMVILPMLLMMRQEAKFTVAVSDPTGTFLPAMEKIQADMSKANTAVKLDPKASALDRQPQMDMTFQDATGQKAEDLRAQVEQKKLDGYLIIPADPFKAESFEFYARNLSNFAALSHLESIANRALFLLKSQALKLDDQNRAFLAKRIDLKAFRVEKGGAKEEKGFAAFFAVMGIFITLYMLILIYGQFIMRAVLEEKTTRVVEILASSVPPFQLMMGKIIGVSLAGLTQVAIWGTCLLVLSAGAFGFVASTGSLPSLTATQLIFFVVFFLLGYFLYATLYAAVGAMFNNEQEAQQMAMVVVIPVIIPVLLMQSIIASPDSTMSVVMSMIPIFTPLLMYLRILVETPPAWQIALSLVLTFLTLVGAIYVCGKIYRIGILMYGKRPNIKELWRWVRA